MKLTFQLGFALICIGMAIAAGVNYLDMQQFETRLNHSVSARSASEVSGIRHSIEAKDEFSQKYIPPELSAILLRDFSSIDIYSKSELQNIRDSVTKKKTDALHGVGMFLLFAGCMVFVHYSVLRKTQAKQV
jgi:hypothetical protein